MANKYSLTFPQKNIWLVENFYESKKINSISGSLKIYKDFDVNIAKQTINKFVELNDAMRIKLKVNEDEVYQVISEYTKFDIDVKVVDKDNKKEIEKIKKEFVSKTINALDQCLFSYLIIDNKDKGEIVLNVHHIISDAWSVSKMGEALAKIYDKIQNKQKDFESYPSYIEFIQKEEEYIKSEKYQKDGEFWKEYLNGYNEPVGLKDGEVYNTTKAKRYKTKLNRALEKKLNIYCKENKISPYTVFMTAAAIYIKRVTEKEDVVIGTPVLNRSNYREKNMQGMFVSTMPVRFKIDENDTFLDLCKKTATDTMGLFRHQKYPYSKISEHHKKQAENKDKLYKVMLSYQNARTEFADKEKYEITWDFSGEIQDELEIHVSDLNNDGRLNIFYDYIVGLFEDIEIKYLAKRIEEIIRDGIENNKTIETINIMPEEEKNKILYEFNDTKRPYPKDKTVIDLFEEQVIKTPNNIALVFEGKEMTYRELNEKANQVAWYLKEKGVKEHDMVAITLDRSIELMIAILAILKTGGCYVPIDKDYAIERKKYMIEESDCKLNIIDNKQDEQFTKDNLNIYEFEYKNENIKNINRNNTYTWDSLVYVMYTSGTTGEPKGAMITNRNIVRLVKNTNYIKFKSNDRIIQTGATVFDACTFEYWGALLNGLRLYLISKEDLINPMVLEKFLINNEISVMFITTALFNQMVEYKKNIFSTLRVLLTGGEVMSIKHINSALKNNINTEISNIYGPTENTTFSNFCKLNNMQKRRVPIGISISNTTSYVLDSKQRLLPTYVEGELCLGGDGVSKGYFKKQKLTNEKFIKDPFSNDKIYKTGDIVQMLEDGNIDFIGRRDNQVKIRGFRIELDEIKNAIMKDNKDINDAVIIIKDDNKQKKILAYFTSKKQENAGEIISSLKEKLPNYMIPSGIMQLDKLPLNQNGKVDIRELDSFYDLDVKETLISENTYLYKGLYKSLYTLYSNVLNKENIMPYDNFFDIGGDSLLAVQLVTKAMSKNIIITYSDLYKYGSIKELGDMLNEKQTKESISSNIKNIDYTLINDLLQKNKLNKKEDIISKNYKIKDIILVGATGFLGAHILYEYLNNYRGIIYCFMRGDNINSEKKRLVKRLNFFFKDINKRDINNRIRIIKGDITDNNIIHKRIENISNISTVINCAACVKHFGNIDYFKQVNEIGVKNLAEFCKINNKRFIHVSTLSVSGNILETGQIEQTDIVPNTVYNETNFYIGQNLDNVYAYSKFMGEKVVYNYITNYNLDAKIMRMGNLTGRSNDGKFQPNVEENAFANRLKTIIDMGVIPDNILEFYLEFTPIDYAARAILLLSKTDNKYNTYHLFNHKHAQMIFVDKVFNSIGINLKHITKKEMTNLLEKYMNQENGYQKIQGLILDINKNKEIEYKPNTIVKSEFTIESLKRLRFKWPKITKKYIKKYIKYLYNINFLKGDK